MDAGEHLLTIANLSADQGDMRFAGKGVLEHVNIELAVVGRELRGSHAADRRPTE
jgi:hypothetical protein